jgi:acetyltransferase-like isoleucine patch superfamily enzyme
MFGLILKFIIILKSSLIQIPFQKKSFFNGFRIGSGSVINNPSSISIGNKVNIGKNAVLNCSLDKKTSLNIGDNVYIGRDFQLNAYQSVVIEDDALISDRVYISDATHNYDSDKPIKNQGTRFLGEVCIKSGSWIGIGSVIMPGVIGKNSVVGANSVVTKNVPENSIVAGSPAKIINSKSLSN